MFTRSTFEQTCKSFAHRHPHWLWVDGPREGYGYLTRSKSYTGSRKSVSDPLIVDSLIPETDVIELEDPVTASRRCEEVHVQQFIVFSASFSIPAFYFTVHDSSMRMIIHRVTQSNPPPAGSPLSLNELVQTAFFRAEVPADASMTPFALNPTSSPFPILSQGDHPTLGTPCWYIHPCEAEKAVGEFMCEVGQSSWTEAERAVRWMELWLMVVASVVDAQK